MQLDDLHALPVLPPTMSTSGDTAGISEPDVDADALTGAPTRTDRTTKKTN